MWEILEPKKKKKNNNELLRRCNDNKFLMSLINIAMYCISVYCSLIWCPTALNRQWKIEYDFFKWFLNKFIAAKAC